MEQKNIAQEKFTKLKVIEQPDSDGFTLEGEQLPYLYYYDQEKGWVDEKGQYYNKDGQAVDKPENSDAQQPTLPQFYRTQEELKQIVSQYKWKKPLIQIEFQGFPANFSEKDIKEFLSDVQIETVKIESPQEENNQDPDAININIISDISGFLSVVGQEEALKVIKYHNFVPDSSDFKKQVQFLVQDHEETRENEIQDMLDLAQSAVTDFKEEDIKKAVELEKQAIQEDLIHEDYQEIEEIQDKVVFTVQIDGFYEENYDLFSKILETEKENLNYDEDSQLILFRTDSMEKCQKILEKHLTFYSHKDEDHIIQMKLQMRSSKFFFDGFPEEVSDQEIISFFKQSEDFYFSFDIYEPYEAENKEQKIEGEFKVIGMLKFRLMEEFTKKDNIFKFQNKEYKIIVNIDEVYENDFQEEWEDGYYEDQYQDKQISFYFDKESLKTKTNEELIDDYREYANNVLEGKLKNIEITQTPKDIKQQLEKLYDSANWNKYKVKVYEQKNQNSNDDQVIGITFPFQKHVFIIFRDLQEIKGIKLRLIDQYQPDEYQDEYNIFLQPKKK
ncbi:hypothetical protein PPERSA_05113 [Pseudocohnilembus persalinus]|uniref:Uncharacterized protein n=1 Tax=Pseudocohnilembus persalinus TaxID=266149 RepID=A0A0V0QWD1_PSEPJ|nr:hypothetical protein PPERSA_05113 [Pseudocohnilembus persalinus]|eukprot:KRX06500.1 hypothetical protein PPERSA_05113 [Pseudocohnilembus persalinus]